MRETLKYFEWHFDLLHSSSLDLLESFPSDQLFTRHSFDGSRTSSFGFELIRSAAEVEKAFGGITTRLWDDPFEWTLPEELADKTSIKNYLNEVRSTRTKGLQFIKHDDELSLQIPAPEKFLSLSEILNETVSRSYHHVAGAAMILNLTKPA